VLGSLKTRIGPNGVSKSETLKIDRFATAKPRPCVNESQIKWVNAPRTSENKISRNLCYGPKTNQPAIAKCTELHECRLTMGRTALLFVVRE
jgi:hypothetical protein